MLPIKKHLKNWIYVYTCWKTLDMQYLFYSFKIFSSASVLPSAKSIIIIVEFFFKFLFEKKFYFDISFFCFVLSLLSRTRKHADTGNCMIPFVRPLRVHAISLSPLREPAGLQIQNKHVFWWFFYGKCYASLILDLFI